MSKMPEYDATAGFPDVHVKAFEQVACRNKMVISSRELNPLCTDLVLEGYAAKGFHIKAKTCDWGPMAGFVPEDHRFTKAKQNLDDQKRDIGKAFGDHAQCVPLFISEERFAKLAKCRLLTVTSRKGHLCEVTAQPDGGGQAIKFTLVKLTVVPPGCKTTMWAIYYHPEQSEQASAARQIMLGEIPQWPGLRPVYGMTNPHASADSGVKAAVAGDYDLWCIFPHSSVADSGIADRLMPLRATLVSQPGQGRTMQKLLKQFPDSAEAGRPKPPGAFVSQQVKAAGLVFESGAQKSAIANAKEDKHLGNISHAVMKIRQELNNACGSAGGNLVQHSDYGGNPFATIDFPLIFFVPAPPGFAAAEALVASNMAELKTILKAIQGKGYILKLNPAWSIPLF